MPTLILCLSGGVGTFLLAVLFGTFFIVEQQTVAVIERFGKFQRIAEPGLNIKIPFIDRVSGKLSLKIQQLNVKAQTKTYDNVFVDVMVSVQYFVIPDRVYDAFYKLDDAAVQINSYVFDVVRARVPNIEIDKLFETKDDIANAVQSELAETMGQFGFGIMNALVTDLDPAEVVKKAMNEINASEREKIAAEQRGEADKIMKVKAAEADAESKALQGKGIADQRIAIVEGLKESIEDFKSGVTDSTSQDVMNLVLMTQYFDTLKDLGMAADSNTIMLPHSPGGMADIREQIMTGILGSESAKEAQKGSSKSGNKAMKPGKEDLHNNTSNNS